MATTDYTERGASLDRLNDRQRRFVLEYQLDYNGTRSAIAAGYSKKTAGLRAIKLLKHKVIQAIIGKSQLQSRKRLELETAEILEQLAYLATRSGADFVDAKGRLFENVHDMPERAQQSIDGIKQKVKRYTLPDGTEIEEVETEFKLVSKLGSIDLAMKHKGLFAEQTVNHNMKMVLDFDAMCEPSKVVDAIDVRLIEEEQTDSESN